MPAASLQLSQAVANRCFIPRRSGSIINVASVAALRTQMHMKAASYYASKAAVLHLTRALAAEWGPYGIRVNAICPGFFPSKLSRGLLEKIEDSVIAQTPLGRLGNDTDLMGAAVYLASAASSPCHRPVHLRGWRRLDRLSRAGWRAGSAFTQKFQNRPVEFPRVLQHGEMTDAGQNHQARAGNVRGHVAGVLGPDGLVVFAVGDDDGYP